MEQQPGEQWREIPGFPDYAMNDSGVVQRRDTYGQNKGKYIQPRAASEQAVALYQLSLNRIKYNLNAEVLYRRVWPDLPAMRMRGDWVERIREKIVEAQTKSAKPGISKGKGNTQNCKRRCKGCGTPTNDYRCGECWKILRGEGEKMDQADYGTSLASVGAGLAYRM